MSGLDNIDFNIIDDDKELFSNNNQTSLGNNGLKNADVDKSSPFDERIKEYLSTKKPCVYLLTPCFASLCYVNYVHSLMNTIEVFRKYGIKLRVEFCKNDSLVSRARNNLVARAMADKEMTHIMFIDNDLAWNPIDIIKLLIADKPLVGGVYPLKNYNWSDLLKDSTNPYNSNVIQTWLQKKNESQFKDMIDDESMLQYRLLKYNINYMNSTLSIDQNLAKVKHIATGFMMIKRPLIEKMAMAFPSTKYVDDVGFLSKEENEYAYALFDCGVEEGHYFSEDWLFCHRWTKMGGEIFIDVSINLTHTGIEDYKGCYLASLI
jgi:hypothetical protein